MNGTHPGAFEYWSRLRDLRSFVEHHLDEALPASRAADIAGLERRYFSTYFRHKVGIGYHSWLETLRVERAKQLLARDDRSVTEVGFDVGFGDLGTFERAFRRRAGLSPREYKKAVEPLPPVPPLRSPGGRLAGCP